MMGNKDQLKEDIRKASNIICAIHKKGYPYNATIILHDNDLSILVESTYSFNQPEIRLINLSEESTKNFSEFLGEKLTDYPSWLSTAFKTMAKRATEKNATIKIFIRFTDYRYMTISVKQEKKVILYGDYENRVLEEIAERLIR